jgi:hypothetical protein
VFNWEEIRERAYVQFEAVIQSPFILAVAAIGKALDDHDENMNWFDLVLNLTEFWVFHAV